MKHFEILPPPDRGIRAQGSTKAALFEAALGGVFAAAAPKGVSGAEQERPFTLAADSAGALLISVLGEALRLSREHAESYDGIRFSLITDAHAEGFFIGRPTESFGAPVESVTLDQPIGKGAEGFWEAVVSASP